MKSIGQNLLQLKSSIPEEVSLVAVSKFQPESSIWEAYRSGQRAFGESKVQEMTLKYEHLPKDIEWHMIGHLQRNKVKYIAPFVHLIHSVDSFRLLEEIQKQAQKHHRTIDCLLQLHIAQEETKFGFSEAELWELLHNETITSWENIRLCGLMTMASFTDDSTLVRQEFSHAERLFQEIQHTFPHLPFHTLSMGMTGDYPLAIECGSTMIRIGSKIFGTRVSITY